MQLDDMDVSRRHAVIELARGGATLTDSGSTNGTWLNGRRVSGTDCLRDGDRIRLGAVELRFYDPGAAVTDPIGTPVVALQTSATVARLPRRVSGALRGRTQEIAPRPDVRRLLLLMMMVLSGGLVLAAWTAWAYGVLG